MKIAMLADVPSRNPSTGVATHTFHLTRELARVPGVDQITLISLLEPPDPAELPGNVRMTYPVPDSYARSRNPLLVPLMWKAIASELRRASPDYIHVQGLDPRYSGAVSLAEDKRNWFITIHGIISREWAFYPLQSLSVAPLSVLWEQFVLSMYPNVILPAHGLSSYLSLPKSANAVTIPHGVQERVVENAQERGPHENPYLLFMGSISKIKGVDLLIRSFSLLKSRGNEIRLLVAGSGTFMPKARRIALKLGVGRDIQWLGAVIGDKKSKLIQGARGIVIPSRWEASPIVLLEAMGQHKLVVAPFLEGIRSMTAGYDRALLFKPGSVEDLAEKINTLLGMNPAAPGSMDGMIQPLLWSDVARLHVIAYANSRVCD